MLGLEYHIHLRERELTTETLCFALLACSSLRMPLLFACKAASGRCELLTKPLQIKVSGVFTVARWFLRKQDWSLSSIFHFPPVYIFFFSPSFFISNFPVSMPFLLIILLSWDHSSPLVFVTEILPMILQGPAQEDLLSLTALHLSFCSDIFCSLPLIIICLLGAPPRKFKLPYG